MISQFDWQVLISELKQIEFHLNGVLQTKWLCHTVLLRMSNAKTATSVYKGQLPTIQKVCNKPLVARRQGQDMIGSSEHLHWSAY